MPHIVGRLVVERLLADRPLRQIIAQRIGDSLGIQELAVQVNHLLLRPADEVCRASVGWILIKRLERRKHLRFEQSPQGVIGVILALVRRCREQQQIVRSPRQGPRLVQAADASQGFGQLVAVCLGHTHVVATARRKLVGLVKDHQVVRHDAGFSQPREHLRPGQRVDADDDPVAVVGHERVRVSGVGPGDDTELKAEESRQLVFPVADQPRRRDDQHPLDEPAGLAFPDVEARHDGLARTGVVGEQKPQRRLLEHVLVNRDPLVRQRVDLRDLGGKGRVEHVAEAQPLALGEDTDDICRSGEVGHRRRSRFGLGPRSRRFVLIEIEDLRPRQGRRLRLPVLPSIYRDERHAQPCRQLRLRQPEPAAHLLDAPDSRQGAQDRLA